MGGKGKETKEKKPEGKGKETKERKPEGKDTKERKPEGKGKEKKPEGKETKEKKPEGKGKNRRVTMKDLKANVSEISEKLFSFENEVKGNFMEKNLTSAQEEEMMMVLGKKGAM